MDEKLKEALINKLNERVEKLKIDKKGLEAELENQRLYDNEKQEFMTDLEKVNEEIEVVQDEKQDIEKLDEQKMKLQREIEEKSKQTKIRKDSLQKDKVQLEQELNNNRLYDNEKQGLENDLANVKQELDMVSKEEKSIKDLSDNMNIIDKKINFYLAKYKIDKEKILTEKKKAENKEENSNKNKIKQEDEIEQEAKGNEEKNSDESETKNVMGVNEKGVNQQKNIHSNQINNNKQEIFDLFQTIEINANSKTVRLIYKNEKNNKELPIKEAFDCEKDLHKRIDLKKELSKYCKQNEIGIFKKVKLNRGLDPLVIQAISYYGGDDDLYSYFNSIAKNESLPFDIHYNLTDSNLDKDSFTKLNKYAKRDRNIEGITAEGVKENIVKRLIKGIKEGNILKTFEKPKQIASKGIGKAKDAKNNITDKAKTTIDNVANKTADKMVKLADKIRVDGHATKIAKEYKEKQSSEIAKDSKSEESRTTEQGREPGDD